MSGFTDYHAHFVYGVDDGAQTREEMYAMLDAAAADGVRHLFATSHSTPGMERFPQEVYDRHLALARAYCTQKGYDLKLEHGSELLYTPAAGYAAVQRQLLTLGDTGWVLLEFVPNKRQRSWKRLCRRSRVRVTAFWWPTLSGIPALHSTACWPACMSSTGCAARSTARLCWTAASGSGCGWSTGSRRGWWTRSLPMHTTAPPARPGCGRLMSSCAVMWEKPRHKN